MNCEIVAFRDVYYVLAKFFFILYLDRDRGFKEHHHYKYYTNILKDKKKKMPQEIMMTINDNKSSMLLSRLIELTHI